MTKTDAWMPLWIGAYLADTMRLTTIQHGAYLLLLIAYWRERAALPDDDEELRSITKLDRAEWKRQRPVLAKFFKIEGGVWWHKRVEQEMAAADARSKKASEKAAKAAEARWGAGCKHTDGDAPSIPPSNAPPILEQCPTPSPITPSLRSGGGRAKALPRPDDVPEQVWADWLQLRKSKKAPVTTTVLDGARDEAGKAGLTLERFLAIWCIRGSQGLQADWLKPHERGHQDSEPGWRTEQRERTQIAAPGVAIGAKPADEFFIDAEEVKRVTANTLG